MMAYFDPTDRYRFETQEEAIEHAEQFDDPYSIVKLSDPLYSDKPFMYIPINDGMYGIRRDGDDDEGFGEEG